LSESNYMCNQTTDWFNVSLKHVFNDSIDYNVSLEVPTDWSYSGAQIINATSQGNYTVTFNLTSGTSALQGTVNATINYTYPGINKIKKSPKTIENNLSIPILEIIRETPKEASNYTELISNLIVYNKGCGTASSISFTETTSTGWTLYSQTIDGSAAGTADIPARQIRFASEDFGTILANEYKIISYKILSNIEQSDSGTLRYNLTWENRNVYESQEFNINTTRYSSEPHLSFDLRA